jgi:hypothetical protein
VRGNLTNLTQSEISQIPRRLVKTIRSKSLAAFEINDKASWLPVATEAPQGLCGAGGVQMIGTWDLIGRKQAFGGDNLTFVGRLLDWLSRKNS